MVCGPECRVPLSPGQAGLRRGNNEPLFPNMVKVYFLLTLLVPRGSAGCPAPHIAPRLGRRSLHRPVAAPPGTPLLAVKGREKRQSCFSQKGEPFAHCLCGLTTVRGWRDSGGWGDGRVCLFGAVNVSAMLVNTHPLLNPWEPLSSTAGSCGTSCRTQAHPLLSQEEI